LLIAESDARLRYPAASFSAPVHASKHPSAFPEASMPSAAWPDEQLVPLAARAVAVPALPDHVPEVESVRCEPDVPEPESGLSATMLDR
jgi:hypothetical protein